MTEAKLEELLYQLMQHKRLVAIASALGYKTATAMVTALKNETIGADELMTLAGILGVDFSSFYNTFFA